MFGALAGKLLVEGRRPILLNHCVPANHRVSCQGGGELLIQKVYWKFQKKKKRRKRIYFQHSQYHIFSIPTTISNVLVLFWALYSFLESHIKVKLTYHRSVVNTPRRVSNHFKNIARRIFLFLNGEKEIWWMWENWD